MHPIVSVAPRLAIALGFVGLSIVESTLASAQPAAGAPTAHARPAAQVVARLHREWILVGWERGDGDGPFDFRRQLGRFYDLEAKDLVLYDDFDPQRRVARRADDYGAIWAVPFNGLRSARHAVVDGPDVLVDGTLATSTLEFTARLERAADGHVTAIRTRSSLVWHRRGDAWKIVREHNSSTVIAVDALERLNAEAGASATSVDPVSPSSSSSSSPSSASPHPYVGMWVTEDGVVRHELLPTLRYVEARGTRERAYLGRYEVRGNRIAYWDDTGFTADGEFRDGVLYHGGMVLRRR